MKKTKFAAIILTLAMMASMAAMPAGAFEIKDINVPIGEARINGIIDPGEWDAATAIIIDYEYMQEKGYPEQNRADMPKGLSTSVKVKVKDGYLYFLEERVNPFIKFYHDDPRFSYESNGGILWFFVDGEPHDLFYMAGTKSNPNAPAFCYRSGNNNDNRVIIQAVEGATVITPGTGSVCEAKIKLSDLELTMADFEGGEMTLYHCTQQVWGDNYNDGHCASVGVENDATLGYWEWAVAQDEQQPGFTQTDAPAWADSGTYKTTADTFDLAALLAKEAAEAEAEAEAAAADAPEAANSPADQPAETPPPAQPSAPQTSDPAALFLILFVLSASAFFAFKRLAVSYKCRM